MSGEVEQANFAGRLHASQRKTVLRSLPIEYGAIVTGIVWTALAKPAAEERIARYGNILPRPDLVYLGLGLLMLLLGLWAVLPRVLEVLSGRVRMMHGRLESADMYQEQERSGLFTRVSYNAQSRFRVNIGVWSLPVDPRIPVTAHGGQEVTVFFTPIRGRVVGISPGAVPGTAGEPMTPGEAELAQVNLAGGLHPSQRKYVRRGYAWPLAWLVFGVFYLYVGTVSKDPGPFVGLAVLLLFLFLRMTYRKVREIRAGRVEPLNGNPRIRVDESNFSGLAVLGPTPGRVRRALAPRYTILVSGREFAVSHRIRLHPARHNTVFVTPRLQRVVNVVPSR
ncbi:MAG TPA: hypothetical protein VJT49_08360 [Amycolatopsis sp.]|uniref:hypothetical protein n=1 Tax=Amycolatopsis sp. TaxID=37632 RepID=UPI002B4A1430|nr:hypothetical protein [Amycolatopsis sp.]HKS45113.1 hypothetical protein [Amycolatopsis sp.]